MNKQLFNPLSDLIALCSPFNLVGESISIFGFQDAIKCLAAYEVRNLARPTNKLI